MGDYVHTSIAIGGHLETVEEAEELLAALNEQFAHSGNYEEENLAWLRAAVEGNTSLDTEEQANYGRFDTIESFVETSPHLSCRSVFGRGDDFDSGSTVVHEGVRHSFDGYGVVSRVDIRKALQEGGAEAVAELVDNCEFLEEKCIKGFTASPAVHAWLKIFAEPA